MVKLGSSVVADSDGEPRMEVLEGVCDDARAGARRGRRGDPRHQRRDRPGHARDEPARAARARSGALQAASAVGQGKLYRIYDELLRERGVISAQVLLTFFDMSARTHYLNARQTLTTLLEWRVLPVINENDTTATDEISFGDNDFLAAQVAVLIGADELILMTDIDGLYTADPRLHPDARIVARGHRLRRRSTQLEIGHTTSPLGSGGMRSKVVAAEMATAAGIPTVICNGLRAEALRAVLAGEREGTRFPAGEARYSSLQAVAEVRQALPRHAARRRRRRASGPRRQREPAAGRRRGGARRVRRRRRRRDRRSAARGGGRAGTLGKGICSYSAEELRSVIGLKSEAVREVLPRATEEAVHRDYLVLD